MILTRYLYDKDEVEISFITALLSNQTIDECLYWIYEYHFSGHDVFLLLWKVYSDFYAVYYPKLESWIKTRHTLFNTNNEILESIESIESIADVVRNLYKKKSSCQVFMMRQFCLYLNDNQSCNPAKIRGRKFKWLKDYDIKYHTLLHCIHKTDFAGICYSLMKINKDDYDALYFVLIEYFKTIKNIQFISEKRIKRKWESRKIHYPDLLHNLLSLIVYLLEDEKNICCKNVFILTNKSNIDVVLTTNSPIPLNEKYNTMQNYYTLDKRRLYSIHDAIGSFRLSRFEFPTHETYVRDIWLHWEYYVWDSSLWRERLKENTLSHETREILFKNDDVMEQFYHQYGYELDERPQNIQDMSLKKIKNTSWKTWYDSIVGIDATATATANIQFPDDFKFYI
jgi:hypothetical protein